MLVIGLTGSIGMGKSSVAARLRALGIAVFDADAEVHRLYAGPAVLLANPRDFARLEAIVHPLVFAAERAFLHGQAQRGARLAVLEVPLLLESGKPPRVDVIIVTSTAADLQRERVLRRPGMTLEKLEQVLRRQMPDAEKRARADYVVDTSGTFAETDAQVDRIVESLQDSQATAFQEFWT
jgi:dephospho-CoA kinase